jgi:murein DD-endopeptidase MepM/ murein hydrolase activator NlpD
MPKAKSDLNAVWMEVQTQKSGGSAPLVTIKLHGVPRKLRSERPLIPAAPVSGDVLLSFLRSKLSTDAEAKLKPSVVVAVASPPAAEQKTASIAVQTTPNGITANDVKMTWPVDGKITSGYGRRGKRSFHSGIDIPMLKGTPIFAAQDGVVLDVGTNQNKKYRGYGNTALLDHGNGIATLYAHCQSVCVKTGQVIHRGDVIGFVGSTGRSTTAHVHFEVRKDGKAVNPLPYLASR